MGYALKDELLEAHLNKIEQNDRHEEAVELRALKLMEYGQEYYPFDPKNLAEAVGEMGMIEWVLASSWATTSLRYNEENKLEEYAASKFGFEIMKNAQAYWLKMALVKAEREFARIQQGETK